MSAARLAISALIAYPLTAVALALWGMGVNQASLTVGAWTMLRSMFVMFAVYWAATALVFLASRIVKR